MARRDGKWRSSCHFSQSGPKISPEENFVKWDYFFIRNLAAGSKASLAPLRGPLARPGFASQSCCGKQSRLKTNSLREGNPPLLRFAGR
ncbi:MAG: hypothetical protein DELT_00365 [Desulfovibrio sp.]